MKTLALIAGTAALVLLAPAYSQAQGIEVGVPGVGVRIGDPGYRHYDRYDRRRWRDREVRYRYGGYGGYGCRTVTIERDDGSVRRVRRCD